MASLVQKMLSYIRPTANGTAADPAALVVPGRAVPDLIRQRPWGGTQYPTADGNLSAETPEIRRRYREMLRCGWVKSAVFSKIWDVGSQSLGMEPEDGDNERDKLVADASTANVNNAAGGVLALVEAFLTGAIIDGYCAVHKLWWDVDRGKWGPQNGRPGYRMLAELRPKDSDYYDLVINDYRRVVGIKERYPPENQTGELPIEDFVIIRHMSIFDSPFGMSDLRAADNAYCCLDAARKLRMIFLDKYTGPFLEGAYEDAAIKDALLGELIEARAGGAVVYPKGTEVKITEMAMSSDSAFSKAEADLKEEIVVSITFAYLQMMGGQVSDGRGDTKTHDKTAKLPKWYLAQLVCRAIDEQITPQFVDWNFAGNPAFPKAKLEGTDPSAILADLEIGAMLKTNGVETSKKEWYKRSGWNPPIDDEDTVGGGMDTPPFADLNPLDPEPVKVGT